MTDQATEQSVLDRVASRFGFPGAEQPEAVEETGEELQPTESDLADIDWEGVTFKAPTKVKEALMRNEDYTRKTQELADQRRTLDQLRETSQRAQIESAFRESVQAEERELSVIDAYLQQANKMDWSSMTTDQMLRHKVEVDNIKERKQALQSAISDKRSQFQQTVEQQMKTMREKSRELASKSIKGFNEQTEGEMRKFAVSHGLADGEFDNVMLDPRSATIIWKAMQFDKVQAGTTSAATQADRVVRPGAASERQPAGAAAKSQFLKALKTAPTSGDKAKVIEQRLEGMFGRK